MTKSSAVKNHPIKLKEIQHGFQQALLDSSISLPLVHPERMALYKNNRLMKLLRILSNTYFIIKDLTGEDCFESLARQYIKHTFPCHEHFYDFGKVLPDFIETHITALNHQLPYLTSLARLAWLSHEVYYEKDCHLGNLDKLAVLTKAQIKKIHFTLHPALRLFETDYPLLELWRFCRQNKAHQNNKENTCFDLDLYPPKKYFILITRREQEVLFEYLTPGEFAFLTALEEKVSFEKASECAVLIEPLFNITECLTKHGLRNHIIGFTV